MDEGRVQDSKESRGAVLLLLFLEGEQQLLVGLLPLGACSSRHGGTDKPKGQGCYFEIEICADCTFGQLKSAEAALAATWI